VRAADLYGWGLGSGVRALNPAAVGWCEEEAMSGVVARPLVEQTLQ